LTAIVVDTSAIIAILRNEPEKDRFVGCRVGRRLTAKSPQH
jgi:uncharacterized protein with PIN domain